LLTLDLGNSQICGIKKYRLLSSFILIIIV
jgi:hypothetical protein